MELNIVEFFLDDQDEEQGINAISIVENPAIEEDFIALKKSGSKIEFAEVNKEQRILMGPLLIPNRPILRRGKDDEEYYGFFSPETVKKASQKYLINGNQNEATIEHEFSAKGLSVVESWIVEDSEKDKSSLYGFDAPIGTWMITMKVLSDDIWSEYVKTKKVKGFSIEGIFSPISRKKEMEALMEAEAEFMVQELKAIATDTPLELESYSDYPKAVRNNAKRGIELNEKVNNKCATEVGKIRAQQLAQGKPISKETIKRMYSYLSRAEAYYKEEDNEACGTISFLLWGGKAGLSWSKSKIEEIESKK